MSALEVQTRLEAREPPEARGLSRDDVALLVATRHDGALAHARFGDLPRFLRPGDLLVVNTSATLPAALPALLDERPVELRLSTPASDRNWVVELRTSDGQPLARPPAGTRLQLPGVAQAELLAPLAGGRRLALAQLELGGWTSTSAGMAARSVTPTCPRPGRSTPTRPCSRATLAAPRCRAPAGRSRRRS